jgi:hypothetical protein
LKIFGQAKSEFNRRAGKTAVFYEGKETYVDEKIYLFGQEGGEAVEMPAGKHRYDFEVELPMNIPGSILIDNEFFNGDRSCRFSYAHRTCLGFHRSLYQVAANA